MVLVSTKLKQTMINKSGCSHHIIGVIACCSFVWQSLLAKHETCFDAFVFIIFYRNFQKQIQVNRGTPGSEGRDTSDS
jgi:hypothetical protein